MKKSKLLILFPVMGLFLSGCTFQEGLQSTKSWINSHIYQPLKSFFGSSSTPSEEGKKDEEKKEEEKKEETKVPFPSSEIAAYVTSLGLSDTVPEFSGTAISYDFDADYGSLDIEVGTGNESAAIATYASDLTKAGYTEGGADSYGDMHYISKNEELDICAWDGNDAQTAAPGHVYVDIVAYVAAIESDTFPLEYVNAYLEENLGYGFTLSQAEADAISELSNAFMAAVGTDTYGYPMLTVGMVGEVADEVIEIILPTITEAGFSYNSTYEVYANSYNYAIYAAVESGATYLVFD